MRCRFFVRSNLTFSSWRAVNTDVGPDLPPRGGTGGANTSELHFSDAHLRQLKIMIQRARTNYEPSVGARVPPPLASLLLACLAVDPSARPSAAGARVAVASLASQADAWGGAAGGDDGSSQLPTLAGTPSDTSGSNSEGAAAAAAPARGGGGARRAA